MEHCNPVGTPMELGTKLSKFEGGNSVEANLYQSLVGSLRYLTCTRPDIAYSVGVVSRSWRLQKQSHWKAIKRILRYVQGTKSLGLFYSRTTDYKLLDILIVIGVEMWMIVKARLDTYFLWETQHLRGILRSGL